MIEHRDAVGEFGGMVIGQEEAARAEPDIFGLQKRLRQQEVGRRVRFPGRGVVLTDPGFLVTEFIQPPQHFQIPVVALLQVALRRMRWHREISDFHGVPLRLSCLTRLVRARGNTRLGCGRMMADGSKSDVARYRVPNVVAPNSAFCVEGCERQYCGGASTWPPSSAAACQPQRGS